MKTLFTSLVLLLFSVFINDLHGQVYDAEFKAAYQEVANDTAYELMNCCSSWGGKNCRAVVDFDRSTLPSRITGSFYIEMTVRWTGSWTGTSYWIKGKLRVNANSGSRTWMKDSDSGGFSPGCSQGCIN